MRELRIFIDRKVISTLLFAGLDLLDELPKDRSAMINWLYSMQYVDEEESIGGFLGGFTIGRDNSGVRPFINFQ